MCNEKSSWNLGFLTRLRKVLHVYIENLLWYKAILTKHVQMGTVVMPSPTLHIYILLSCYEKMTEVSFSNEVQR